MMVVISPHPELVILLFPAGEFANPAALVK